MPSYFFLCLVYVILLVAYKLPCVQEISSYFGLYERMWTLLSHCFVIYFGDKTWACISFAPSLVTPNILCVIVYVTYLCLINLSLEPTADSFPVHPDFHGLSWLAFSEVKMSELLCSRIIFSRVNSFLVHEI